MFDRIKDFELEDSLSKISTNRTFAKGSKLPEGKVYYLKEGVCALTHFTLDGAGSTYLYYKAKRVVNFVDPIIKYMGESTSLSNTVNYFKYYSIYTKTKCTIFVIDEDAFMKEMNKNLKLQTFVLQAACEHLELMLMLATHKTSKTVCARMCQLIIENMSDDIPSQMPTYLTYQEIADYLSMHVITVTKIFKALKEEGIIAKTGHKTSILNKNRLIDIANEGEVFNY